ncbi:DNA polymerase, partial [Herbiconiux daphne]
MFNWYDGGITHVNENYRGQFVDNLTFLDINSSYPSQMVKDVDIPIGEGVKGDVKGFDFKFYTLIPKKTIINKSGIPFNS